MRVYKEKGRMQKIVRFCVYHPYWVIGIVLGITLFFAFQIPKVKIDPRVEVVLRDNNPVEKIWRENKEEFEAYADILIGIMHTNIYNPDSMHKIRAVSAEIRSIEGVKKVNNILNVKNIAGGNGGLDVSPLVADGRVPENQEELIALKEKVSSWDVYKGIYVTGDGTASAMCVVLDDGLETDKIVPIYYQLREIMAKYSGPEEFFISGTSVVEALQGDYMIKDLKLLIPLVNIVLLILLFLFFMNVRGMILPMLVVGISTTWTVGLMPVLDIPLTMVTTTLPVILAAVGSAYAIHVLENVFSDAAEGKRGEPGLINALDRVSPPVVMAGLTTIIAFMSLCASQIVPLKQVGALSGFGLFVAMSISLTFLPAVLSIFERMGMECTPHHHTKKDVIGPMLRWFSSVSLMRSSLVIAVGGGILLVSATGLFLIKSDLDLIKDFRKGSPIRVADEILNENFGGTSMFSVVFNGKSPDDVKAPEVLYEIEALQNRLNKIDGVGKSVSIVDFIKKMNQAMHDGDTSYYVIPESRELVAQYLLLFSFSGGGDDLASFVNYDYQNAQILLQMKSQSGYLAKDIDAAVDEYRHNDTKDSRITEIFTTGLSRLAMEFNRLVVQSQLTSFTISLVLVMFITSFAFRSFKLGLYSMLPLIAPVVLNFGIMGATGVTLNAATAVIASLAIGIGIDDSIHYLSRYRHEILMGRDAFKAIDIAINTSGRAILYYSLAVAAGFLVLIPSNFVIISQMGILVGLAMVTTTMASVTLLPAILKVFPPKITGKEVERPVLEVPVRLAVQNAPSEANTMIQYIKKSELQQDKGEIENEM